MTEKKNKVEVEKKEVSAADKLWEEIKNLSIDMFALPNQVIKQHVQRVKLSPTEVHLKLKSTAVITSLETALGTRYQLEVAEGYVVVRRAPPTLGKVKPEPLEE